MSEPWMDHPRLIAWFDDLEDAVTSVFALTEQQRAEVRARRAPRSNTWVLFARDSETRDALRERLREAQHSVSVPVARDCHVLQARARFREEEDGFERENGFGSVEIDYVEEGSVEDIRRELLSDADDYAASAESGWFYEKMDEESHDPGEREDRGNDWY